MCLGNNQTQSTQNTNQIGSTNQQTSSATQLPQWLTNAAQQNLGYAQGIQSQGFQPYGGPMVAGFSPQQQQSFGIADQLSGGITPYTGQIGSLVSNYANAPAQSVQANTIASQMSPYMNQYVMQALAPQLEALNQQYAAQNKSFDSAATGSGAFGDTSWGLGRTNLTNQQDIGRTGLIGNAYTSAFNTAIGAGAQDVSNKLAAATTNANLAETALGRQLTGAGALYGYGTGIAGLENTFGGQQTAQQQAQLNSAYNQWLMAQQYPFQTTQLLGGALGTARAAAPVSTTGTTTGTTDQIGNTVTSAPNNAGYGILGSLLGAVPSFIGSSNPVTGAGSGYLGLMASDERVKEDIKHVGKLRDGQKVYSYRYVWDPQNLRRIGLLAQEVEKVVPDAVKEVGGIKAVDYAKAVEPSSMMAQQLGLAA